MLLKLINGGILDITEDRDYVEGCHTCDYGSCYTNYFDIKLTTMQIHIESSQMYRFPLSEGHMMKVILPNVNIIQNMTEMEFSDWLKENLTNAVNCELKYIVI
jgi:hypothetical protein